MDDVAAERIRKCRAHAERCRAWADLSEGPAIKASYLALAEEWNTLSSEIDEIGKKSEYVRLHSRA